MKMTLYVVLDLETCLVLGPSKAKYIGQLYHDRHMKRKFHTYAGKCTISSSLKSFISISRVAFGAMEPMECPIPICRASISPLAGI